jgi:hypothetical protein
LYFFIHNTEFLKYLYINKIPILWHVITFVDFAPKKMYDYSRQVKIKSSQQLLVTPSDSKFQRHPLGGRYNQQAYMTSPLYEPNAKDTYIYINWFTK